jgi:hypothetical protein
MNCLITLALNIYILCMRFMESSVRNVIRIFPTFINHIMNMLNTDHTIHVLSVFNEDYDVTDAFDLFLKFYGRDTVDVTLFNRIFLSDKPLCKTDLYIIYRKNNKFNVILTHNEDKKFSHSTFDATNNTVITKQKNMLFGDIKV